jgi:hypothetical protein
MRSELIFGYWQLQSILVFICLRPKTPLLPSEIFLSMEIFQEKKVPAILKVWLIVFFG